MSVDTIIASRSSTFTNSKSAGESSSATQVIDTGVYTYKIPKNLRDTVCHYLDQRNMWKEAATTMGYAPNDFIRVERLAGSKSISYAEQLLSLWDDQNHTVTELFMVLYGIHQFEAMEYLKDYVEDKYHLLLTHRTQILQKLLPKSSTESGKSMSNKILNGPVEISRDTNESDSYTGSMQTSSMIGILNNLNEEATVPQIAYSELEEATNRWDAKNKLGSGGFGDVYKGRWKYTDVAIKKIRYRGGSNDSKQKEEIQIKQSLNELRHLNSCRHDNILPLYGYCIDAAGQCLVYQYMSGGSLEYRLHVHSDSQKPPLTFDQRREIALGTARGLQYLHTFNEFPLVHGDIKPANILLDSNFTPKIGDFGLVRVGANDPMKISCVFGTTPYLPDELIRERILSTKVDTYSYGIVLFELFTGLKAYDKRRQSYQFLATYMHSVSKDRSQITTLIDKGLDPAQVCVKSYMLLIKIAYQCIEKDAEKRPEMTEVFNHLDEHITQIKLPENTL